MLVTLTGKIVIAFLFCLMISDQTWSLSELTAKWYHSLFANTGFVNQNLVGFLEISHDQEEMFYKMYFFFLVTVII